MAVKIHKAKNNIGENVEFEGIQYGFFGATGGVSKGIYESLNCGKGSKDEPKNVAQNLAIVAKCLEEGENIKIQTANQQHTNKAVVINELVSPLPVADGLVTTRKHLAIGILTADCVPILLFSHSPQARVVGAAHGCWRGLKKGIIASTIAKMRQLLPPSQPIVGIVGPAIDTPNYQVGKDFPIGSELAQFITPSHHFDLRAATTYLLRQQGVDEVFHCDISTYEDGFFSCRRTLSQGNDDYGRQISTIALV